VLSICLLADKVDYIPHVAQLRWREWGHAPAPEDPEFWLETTTHEAGRDDLPVTLVAIADDGGLLGAVGLTERENVEPRPGESPWVAGMIVAPEGRGRGVGRALLRQLEQWAVAHGFVEAWVATESAGAFYERCGWTVVRADTNTDGEQAMVLHQLWASAVEHPVSSAHETTS
jgi:GNAT superfamily N-acetyltransferase